MIKSDFLQSWQSQVPRHAGQPQQPRARQGRWRVCTETPLPYFAFNDPTVTGFLVPPAESLPQADDPKRRVARPFNTLREKL